MQFGLAHQALHPEQQPVVEQRRVVEPVTIAHQLLWPLRAARSVLKIGSVAR